MMTMTPRQQRGLHIFRGSTIRKSRIGWRVPSQSNQGTYIVSLDDPNDPLCSCPDFETRHQPCKHIFAVEFKTERRTAPDGTVTETDQLKVTFQQDWQSYDLAQTHEKDLFQVLLKDLCKGLAWPAATTGRPRVPLSDQLFSAVFKVYSTVSVRRFMSDLRAAHRAGHISRLPHFTTLQKVFDDPGTAAILTNLIEVSALPLSSVESHFSADSSGFGSCRFDRWVDHRQGITKMRRKWVKAHVMVGTKTNIITAIEIAGMNAADSPRLPSLLDKTAKKFSVKEVSADLGYSADSNLQAIESHGAAALIPFRKNTIADNPQMSPLWNRLYHFYSYQREEFNKRYHQRSNVESCFHMIKSKTGDSVRAKGYRTMKSEVLAKALVHNICVLIQSFFELGIDPTGWWI